MENQKTDWRVQFNTIFAEIEKKNLTEDEMYDAYFNVLDEIYHRDNSLEDFVELEMFVDERLKLENDELRKSVLQQLQIEMDMYVDMLDGDEFLLYNQLIEKKL